MSSILPSGITISQASNNYRVNLKADVYLQCSRSATVTDEKITRSLGAIGTYQLVKDDFFIKAEKCETDRSEQTRDKYLKAMEAFNRAIEAMDTAFNETGIYDSSYKGIDKAVEQSFDAFYAPRMTHEQIQEAVEAQLRLEGLTAAERYDREMGFHSDEEN